MEILPGFLRRPATGIVVGVVLVAYAAAGFLLVPMLVRSLATDLVRADYGRELALGAIRFNPFTLTLEVEALALPDAGEGLPPLVAVERLRVNLQSSSLWRRALTFREIAVTGLAVNAVVRPGGDLNLADLAAEPAAAPPPAEEGGLPALRIGELRLESGRIRFTDQDRPEPFVAEIAPLVFSLSDFSTYADTGNQYRFDARIFGSTRLAWRGTLQAEPLASAGLLVLEGLPLPELGALLGDALPLAITGGTASLQGRYRYGADTGELRLEEGSLAVTALSLGQPGGEGDLVSLPRVNLTGIRADGKKAEAEVASVVVEGGEIRAWRNADGTLNLAPAPAPAPASAPGTDTPADATGPAIPPGVDEGAPRAGEPAAWQVRVPSMALRGLNIAFEDRSVAPAAAFRIEPLDLEVTGFATDPGTVATVKLAATLASGGRLSSEATVNLDTQAAEASLAVDQLNLAAVQPYLEATTGITLVSGLGSLQGQLQYAPADPGAPEAAPGTPFSFTGDVAVADFRTVDDTLREDLVKWQGLELKGLDYRGRPERLRIREITARDPYARIIIGPDGITNVARALAPPGTVLAPAADDPADPEPAGDADPAGPKAPPEPPTPFPVSIGAVSIRNGSTQFTDLATRPRFSTGIEALNGRITGLSSASRSRAKVDLKGQVDPDAPVTIRGEVNPLSAETYLDLAMTFRNVDLADFTPYSGRFAGYTIRQGTLSVDLNYEVENRQLKADHQFVIDQLELGDRVDSAEAASLPLKLAVALLKDRNGVIDLELPVTGDLDDPKFRIGPILWKVFVNLITRAATAPFALLGKLVGGDEDLNIMDFRPGRAALTAVERERAANLARALIERPALALEIPAVYNARVDRPALAERELERRVLARALGASAGAESGPDFDTVAADRAAYLALLKAEFRATAGKDVPWPEVPPAADGQGPEDPTEPLIALLEQGLRARIEVPEAALADLANRRATTVRDALVEGTGVDPGRVSLGAPAEGKAEGGVVVMELGVR